MKKLLLVCLAWALAACAPVVPMEASSSSPVLVISTSLPQEMLSPVPTWRALIPPTPTSTPIRPTVMPTTLVLPTPTGPGCMQLIEPPDGASFAKHDHITLKWAPLPGVTSYIALIDYPSGIQEKVKASGTKMIIKLPFSPDGAIYRWSVLAYDAKQQLVCSSNTLSFTINPGSGAVSPSAPATGQ